MKTHNKKIQTIDGSTIFYKISGNGFPVFLLHGNGGNRNFFKYQIPILSHYFKVFAIDSRGHGHSSNNSRSLSFELMADDLASLMEQEQIEKSHFVGFSDGANLALTFAIRYPEKVRSLVLNSGNTLVSGVILPAKLLTDLEYFLVSICALFSRRMSKKKQVLSLMTKDIGISRSDLQTIQIRTLIIVGNRDVIKQSHSLYLARNIPNAELKVIKGQGHSFARKNPNVFNQELLKFLLKK